MFGELLLVKSLSSRHRGRPKKKFINLRGKILQARQVPLSTYADGTEKKTFSVRIVLSF